MKEKKIYIRPQNHVSNFLKSLSSSFFVSGNSSHVGEETWLLNPTYFISNIL